MKQIFYILLFFYCQLGFCQAPAANELIAIHSVNSTEMNAVVNAVEGSLIYNTDDKFLYQYNGSVWVKNTSEGNKTKIIAAGHTTASGNGVAADPYLISSPITTFTSNTDGSYTFSNGVDTDVIFVPVTPSNEPLVSSIVLGASTCAYLGVNETRDIVIKGHYFDGASTVTIQGQTVNTIQINNPNQITANITTGNSVGNFNVITTNNIGTGTLIGGLLIQSFGAPTTKSISLAEMTLTGTMTYDGTTLNKTASAGWNSQGYSTTQAISAAGGRLNFTANQSNRHLMAGLSYEPAKSASYTDLSFALYLVSNAQIQVRENGTSLGYLTTYTTGDVLSIEVDCLGKVTYLKNDTVFYTSSATALSPLYFDTSFHTVNAAISNISMTY